MEVSDDDQPNSGMAPFKPNLIPMCRGAILKVSPHAAEDEIKTLGAIWDEVVHEIVKEVIALASEDVGPLHVNIREGMVLEIAKLQLWLSERVIEKRVNGRELSTIDRSAERKACLGTLGAGTISSTAQLCFENIWKPRMDERWKPKSAKAIEREKNSREDTLAVKPVSKNHFIPKWFIRDLWSIDGRVQRWKRDKAGWVSKPLSFGQWGYRQKLYSDRLEAYFALIEGDAKLPIEMLLDTRPLNGPQRESLVGFMIIQMLRNPFFMESTQHLLMPVIEQAGYADDPTMAERAFESMFSNNEFYDELARPVMWSQWAIVRSKAPLFVLPDTFGLQGDIGDGLRIIVPLTPDACFVTLPDRENKKRIVPRHLQIDEKLARKISAALIHSAREEFLSHQSFAFNDVAASSFSLLLDEISQAVTLKGND